MEEKEVILTQEGFDKIEKELEYLRTEKRSEIADRIKVALGFGDLSENSEYDEAKNAQAENEAKIAELENKVRYAKIIDEKDIDTKTVQIGNTVTLYDIEFDEEVEYTIVGSTEVNLAENKISNESPIGKALLGAKKGATVEVNAPAGIIKYETEKMAFFCSRHTFAGWDCREHFRAPTTGYPNRGNRSRWGSALSV